MIEPELQRWSREVAEDPGASSFVALARAYRRQGRRDAALSVVLRGLERVPENVEGHALLAMLYVDAGERERAGDEWETMLRFEPASFEAHRGLAFLSLERGDLAHAHRHLDAAARVKPDDAAVAQARQVLARREAAARNAGAAKAATNADAQRRDPVRLFEPLRTAAPFLGALVLDGQGLVLAGSLEGGHGSGETLGALLHTAVEEARRTTSLLELGGWHGLMLECEKASLHVAPLEGDAVVLLAARGDAPAGWVARAAERARSLARAFLERGA